MGVAAFYGGAFWQKQKQEVQPDTTSSAQPTPLPAQPNQASAFEQERARVDKDPKDWIEKVAQPRISREGKLATEIDDPEFLYLYGRAHLLSANYAEADKAFKSALSKLKETNPLRVDIRMAEVIAVAGLSKNFSTKTLQDALKDLEGASPQKNSMVPATRPEGATNGQVVEPTPTP